MSNFEPIFNSKKRYIKYSESLSLRGEGISGMIDPDEEVVGPEDLDSNATEVDKFPKSVGVFKNSSKTAHLGNDLNHPWPEDTQQQFVDHAVTHHNYHSRDFDDAPRSSKEYEKYLQNPLHIQEEINGHRADHENNGGISGEHPHSHDDWTVLGSKITSSWKTADSAGGSEFGNPIDYSENRMQSLTDTSRLQSRFPIDDGQRNYSEQRADANPLNLRSLFTGDDVNGPWPHTKNLSGPLDFEPTDDQNKDSTGPVMGSFNSKISHFDDLEHSFPTEDDIRKHLETHHFGENNPMGNDYLEQTFRERPPLSDKELLGEHLNFHYDDDLIDNPLVGKSSWILPHKHGDDIPSSEYEDINKLGSFNSKYAHKDLHPWPKNSWELEQHLGSHHRPGMRMSDGSFKPTSAQEVIETFGYDYMTKNHQKTHSDPNYKSMKTNIHDHDDDFNEHDELNVPDNIEVITPTYITSSWHEAFVGTFDTHPDEESPDTRLNPADELKNGRPRANDLPNQSAQLVPGMLIDHDQMGGSGTASGSF